MENFKMVEVKDAPRVELHNLLGLGDVYKRQV